MARPLVRVGARAIACTMHRPGRAGSHRAQSVTSQHPVPAGSQEQVPAVAYRPESAIAYRPESAVSRRPGRAAREPQSAAPRAGRCALLLAWLAAGLAWPAAPVLAQDAAPMPKVVIARVKDPVDKSYRAMIKGMERFERERAFAPQASLRFRLWPRLPNTSLDGVTLRVAGDTVTLPVPIDPDHSFVLERNEQALREDAAVLANRKTSSLTWRAWVRTPGLPPDVRRLGDLRLECRVGMDARLISNSAPLFGWLSNMLANTEETCTSPQGNYLFFAERPIFGVTLRDGARREALPFKLLYASGEQTAQSLPFCDCQVLLDRSYYAPLWDRGWSDDTLLEFEYMDLPAAAPKAAP